MANLTSLPLLAQAQAQAQGALSLGDALIFVLGGFTMVLMALIGLFIATKMNGVIVKVIISRKSDEEAAKAAKAAEAAQAAEAKEAAEAAQPGVGTAQASIAKAGGDGPQLDDATLLALISSAVYVALDDTRARIVSIKPSPQSRAWSVEGRRAIFDSHKIR